MSKVFYRIFFIHMLGWLLFFDGVNAVDIGQPCSGNGDCSGPCRTIEGSTEASSGKYCLASCRKGEYYNTSPMVKSCMNCPTGFDTISANYQSSLPPYGQSYIFNIAECVATIESGKYYDDGDVLRKCNYDTEGKAPGGTYYCPGGEFLYSSSKGKGLKDCPSGYIAAVGAKDITECFTLTYAARSKEGSYWECSYNYNDVKWSCSEYKCENGYYCPGEVYPGDEGTGRLYYKTSSISNRTYGRYKCPTISTRPKTDGKGYGLENIQAIYGPLASYASITYKSINERSKITDCVLSGTYDKSKINASYEITGANGNMWMYENNGFWQPSSGGYFQYNDSGASDERQYSSCTTDKEYFNCLEDYGLKSDLSGCEKCLDNYSSGQDGKGQVYISSNADGYSANVKAYLAYNNYCEIKVDPGYYIAKAKDTSSTECLAGYYCIGGYVRQGNTGNIKACKAGTYNQNKGGKTETACTGCGINLYSAKEGSASCSVCGGGQKTEKGAQTSCINCENNTDTSNATSWGSWGYWCIGSTDCPSKGNSVSGTEGCTITKCKDGIKADEKIVKDATGRVSGKGEDSKCVYTGTCLAGYYNPTAGSGSAENLRTITCSRCQAGYYCEDGNASTTGTKCPDTYPNSEAGSSSKNNCSLTTGVGKYVGKEEAAQTDCPEGHYCLGGTVVLFGGLGGETACPAGTYRSSKGAKKKDDCIKCPVGSYSSAGSSSCTPCSAGTKTSDKGSTSSSACSVQCHEDPQKSYIATYKDVKWAENKVTNLCEIATCNTISKGTGVDSAEIKLDGGKCTPVVSCSGGYHTPKPTATENLTTATCTGCRAGYYCTGGAASETSCADGTYSIGKKSECDSCATNAVYTDKTETRNYPNSDASGGAATSINACYLILSAGYYVAGVKKGQVACKAGSYCPGCIDPTGTWTMGGDDATKCETNSKIYYGTGYGSGKTTGGAHDCYVGTYGENASTERQKPSQCTPCAGGASTSKAGSTTFKQCHLTDSTEFCDSKGCFTLPFFKDLNVYQQNE